MTVNGKTRLLHLLKYLHENTDEDHPVTTGDIARHFSALGAVIGRKTVADDVTALQEFGIDIVSRRGGQNSYFLDGRLFEFPELKLLIDAVEASKFVTAKKSAKLAGKLTALAGKYRAEGQHRHLYIADRVTPLNEKRRISFRYFAYNVERKRYRFSPYGRMWNEDHYYEVGYSEKHGKIVTFRADRIVELEILKSDAVPSPRDFSLPEFACEVFDM